MQKSQLVRAFFALVHTFMWKRLSLAKKLNLKKSYYYHRRAQYVTNKAAQTWRIKYKLIFTIPKQKQLWSCVNHIVKLKPESSLHYC